MRGSLARRANRLVRVAIAFAHHKGGCSKTTSVANVGWTLALLGRQVLVVDADPQGNLTELLGLDPAGGWPLLEDVLADAPLAASACWPVDGIDGLMLL